MEQVLRGLSCLFTPENRERLSLWLRLGVLTEASNGRENFDSLSQKRWLRWLHCNLERSGPDYCLKEDLMQWASQLCIANEDPALDVASLLIN
ncbi:unnamed protein product [Victoria cruziana]